MERDADAESTINVHALATLSVASGPKIRTQIHLCENLQNTEVNL